jgi:hypothetical protein
MRKLIALLALLLATPTLAATRDVGTGHTYSTVAAAQGAASNGDSVVVWGPGTFIADWVTVNHNDLKFVCRDSHGKTFDDSTAVRSEMPIFDGNGTSDPTAHQGIWRTTNTTARCEVNGGEFRNTSNLAWTTCTANGPNSVPFRIQSGCTGLFWLHNCIFHDCDMNYNGGPESLLVEKCVIYQPNNNCGNQHDMYIQPAASSSTPGTGAWWFMIRWCQIYAPNTGNCIQSRAVTTYVLYNRIYDGNGTTPNANVYVNDGGLAYIIGNTIEQSNTPGINTSIVGYSTDGTSNSGKITNGFHCFIYNNTIVNKYVGGGVFITSPNGSGSTITYDNNIFYGDRSAITSGPATFVDGGHNYSETGSNNGVKFLNVATGDYHLTAASPSGSGGVLDQAVANGTHDGFNCTPTAQYVYDRSSVTRTTSGSAADIGAFEFGSSGGGGGGGGSDPCTPF